ncbi:hypothetical protein [Kribbella sp. CA-293567]|uniref:hypothetical protein n=1 Tax=Kribbella sp. CA-293567 TaxID=3002436 RepID=UPI0022DDCA88|nr:hypothetical protein [Kribbella sp. CA-293567]WBQ05206.1 hypothetical protein OX958_00045 [Kribbella sp. CA-293567]
MGGRLVRGTAIACGVAAVAGLGIGFAVGQPVQPDDVRSARVLPGDLCSRLGDVSPLLPKATNAKLVQSGRIEVMCAVSVPERGRSTFSAAELTIKIRPYAGRRAGQGQPPFTPDEMAKQAFDRQPWLVVGGRAYPTKVEKRAEAGRLNSRVSVLVRRGDLTVQVDYAAHPVEPAVAQQAALVMADRAVWESK